MRWGESCSIKCFWGARWLEAWYINKSWDCCGLHWFSRTTPPTKYWHQAQIKRFLYFFHCYQWNWRLPKGFRCSKFAEWRQNTKPRTCVQIVGTRRFWSSRDKMKVSVEFTGYRDRLINTILWWWELFSIQFLIFGRVKGKNKLLLMTTYSMFRRRPQCSGYPPTALLIQNKSSAKVLDMFKNLYCCYWSDLTRNFSSLCEPVSWLKLNKQ
jgi:hypothetical protein